MVDVLQDPAGDDDVQTLLEAIGDANPDADTVVRTSYHGHVLDLITVVGKDNDTVEVPEIDGFELETTEPLKPDDEEMKQQLVEDGKVPEGYWDGPLEPAQIAFERA